MVSAPGDIGKEIQEIRADELVAASNPYIVKGFIKSEKAIIKQTVEYFREHILTHQSPTRWIFYKRTLVQSWARNYEEGNMNKILHLRKL